MSMITSNLMLHFQQRAVTKSNVSSKNGYVSYTVIKWSNEGGRLSNNVITTSLSFMGTSKHVSWSTRILLCWCDQGCYRLRPSWWWRICAIWIRCWISFWFRGCCIIYSMLHRVFCMLWCAPTFCLLNSWRWWQRPSYIIPCKPYWPRRLPLTVVATPDPPRSPKDLWWTSPSSTWTCRGWSCRCQTYRAWCVHRPH